MFSKDFIWGTATSAYQIEGAYNTDGKGASIWDDFSNTPGNTANNETGNIACDHYHHYKEDIKLMHELGIKAYRFSISWSRIFPDGYADKEHAFNKAGLDFYDNIVNCCIEYGITPYITLYHWDLPSALEKEGGWLNRQTSYIFADYAEFICRHFNDRVTQFATINEPQIISGLGYKLGLHAPGLKLKDTEVLKVTHHLALAHGLAVKRMREAADKKITISFSSTGNMCYPKTLAHEDVEAARTASFTTDTSNWTFCHHIFCDMVCLGQYPDLKALGNIPELADYNSYDKLDFVKESDIDIMHQPIDWLGINMYNGHEFSKDGPVPKKCGFPRTALGWPVTPGVMDFGIRFLYERYKLPIVITENGLACNDIVSLDNKVHDLDRIDFLTRYINCLCNAYNSGVPIAGYFHWSFLDNYEWHSGYDPRFGLVYVDFETQERIPKDSAYWYHDLITGSKPV